MPAKLKFRSFLFVLMFNILAFNGISQEADVSNNHYLFPQFKSGTVLMTDGIRNLALLNYNTITSEMVFDNNGNKLALAQPDLVDTVYISGRKFVPMNKAFSELIYHSKTDLFIEHKATMKDPGKSVGYGGTSQTTSVSNYSSILSGGQLYELKLEGVETESSVKYTLKKDGVYKTFFSLRQLYQLFPEKSDLIKKYRKDHNLKYENQETLIELIKYLENTN